MSAPANIQIPENLQKLSLALQLYARASGKAMDAVVREKSGVGKGAFLSELRSELRKLAPARGSIRAARLAALKAGEGLRIRAAAAKYADEHTMATASDMRTRAGSNFREKTKKGNIKSRGRTWWQLAVRRELSFRESGRGFTAQTSRLLTGGGKIAMPNFAMSESREGPILATGTAATTDKGTSVTFKWGPYSQLSAEAVKALGRARGMQAVANTITRVVSDIIPYIDRKLGPEFAAKLK